jgi:hypothetical protein
MKAAIQFRLALKFAEFPIDSAYETQLGFGSWVFQRAF